MCAYKANIYTIVIKLHNRNKPKLIAPYVKDISQTANRVYTPKTTLHVHSITPLGSLYNLHPVKQSHLALRVCLVILPNTSYTNYPHIKSFELRHKYSTIILNYKTFYSSSSAFTASIKALCPSPFTPSTLHTRSSILPEMNGTSCNILKIHRRYTTPSKPTSTPTSPGVTH